jgi:hypothetical protein
LNSVVRVGDKVAVMARTKAEKKYARAKAKNTTTAMRRGKWSGCGMGGKGMLTALMA